MAGGAIAAAGSGRCQEYKGKTTGYVIITCIVAASAGLLFGYDNGIAGGVVAMPEFHEKFFPDVGESAATNSSPYCKYNDHVIQLFVSCLFVAGAVGALIGSHTSNAYGRRITMLWGGISFLAGALLQANAVHVAMLIVGRVLLGLGVGLSAQSAPVFLSEMAPFHLRGAMNIMFQLAITIGILVAQLINYGAQYIHPWGWQLALGLAAVPALTLSIGAYLLPETPNSLIERQKNEEGRKVLERIRGTSEVDVEYEDICEAAAASRATGNQWATIIKPGYRPQLLLAIIVPALQQLTGINSVIFYAPQLFESLGKGTEMALLTTVIIGAVNVGTTVVAMVSVDRAGRRFWFLEGGVQMIVAEVIIGTILGTMFTAEGHLPASASIVVIVFICVFIAGFAWSWGPLAWLVCSEVQPLETRSAGYAITVASNFVLTFVIGQCFLSMLCAMKFGIFYFFAGWVLIMTIFAMLFIPETKGVPIEEIEEQLFVHHWFWGRLIAGHSKSDRRWSDAEKRSPDARPGVRKASIRVEMDSETV